MVHWPILLVDRGREVVERQRPMSGTKVVLDVVTGIERRWWASCRACEVTEGIAKQLDCPIPKERNLARCQCPFQNAMITLTNSA